MPAPSRPPQPRSPQPSLSLDYHVPGHCMVSAVQNVALYVWWGTPTGADTDALYDHSLLMTSRFPQGVSALHYTHSTSGLPDHAAREGFRRILRDFGANAGEVGVVLAGGGFWASAMRSMIAGIHMATPLRVGMRVGTSIEEVMRWFPEAHAKATGTRVTASDLEAALGHLIDQR